MSRKDSRVIRNITRLCSINEMDENVLYKRSLTFLKLFQEMGWNVAIFNGKNIESDLVKSEDSIRVSLDYLMHLPEDDEDYIIEKNLKPLFDSGIVREIMNYSLNKVKEYPHGGEIYYRCINLCFLDGVRHTSDDIIEALNLSRGTYYDKRKEAIILFGVTLWSFAIPYLLKHLNDSLLEFKQLIKDSGNEK
ncbi:MAG: hypothetical protein IJ224_06720 [Lachnospiraceae bacterium]|nr:hypothetical protein [Lachnospiraceae bacterium]